MYAIYAYIDPPNHPNVGIYDSPMESLGLVPRRDPSWARILWRGRGVSISGFEGGF